MTYKTEQVVSGRGRLVLVDVKKFLKGLCYAVIGAAGAYALTYLEATNFGEYQVFATPVISFAAHLLHKFFGKSVYMTK